MRIPPIHGLPCSGKIGFTKNYSTNNFHSNCKSNDGISKDTVSFSSKAHYIKKYNTLPDEIKKILKPKDAIDMFIDMEKIAKNQEKGEKVGQGENSKVYENPWLDDYYILILQNPTQRAQIIFSEKNLGDSIWQDNEDSRIQIIKGAA